MRCIRQTADCREKQPLKVHKRCFSTWAADVHEGADGQVCLVRQATVALVHLEAQTQAAKPLLCQLTACSKGPFSILG